MSWILIFYLKNCVSTVACSVAHAQSFTQRQLYESEKLTTPLYQ